MPTFEDLYTSRLDLELNNSDSNVLYTTARRKQAVNDGVAEFASLTECYVRRASIPVSCNTAEYALSTIADYSRVYQQGLIEYHHTSSGASSIAKFTQLAGDDFPRRDELWLNRYEPSWRTSTTPAQFPQYHYVRPSGGQLVVGLSEPPKVGSSETARLVVPYVARPQSMVNSTDVPFTDTSGNTRQDLVEYHQAASHFAAHRLLPLIGDEEGADRQLQKFLSYVKRYLDNMRPKGGQHVTVARSYYRSAQRRPDTDASLDRDPRWRWT